MTSTRTAQVIGGGVGDSTVATALAQRGWKVRPHSRASEIRAIGAGIYVWGNGLASLEALELYDDAVIGAHVGRSLESRDHNGRTVERIEINTPGQPRVKTIMRERLIGALVDGATRAGAEIVTDSEVVSADEAGSVTDAEGNVSTADVVVAADGVHVQPLHSDGRRALSTQPVRRRTKW